MTVELVLNSQQIDAHTTPHGLWLNGSPGKSLFS